MLVDMDVVSTDDAIAVVLAIAREHGVTAAPEILAERSAPTATMPAAARPSGTTPTDAFDHRQAPDDGAADSLRCGNARWRTVTTVHRLRSASS